MAQEREIGAVIVACPMCNASYNVVDDPLRRSDGVPHEARARHADAGEIEGVATRDAGVGRIDRVLVGVGKRRVPSGTASPRTGARIKSAPRALVAAMESIHLPDRDDFVKQVPR